MKDRPSRPRSLALLATMALGACTSGSSTSDSSNGPSGTQALAPGQAKRVSTAPVYGTIRVCNNTTSKGTVTVTIDSRESAVLVPGVCTEESVLAGFALQRSFGCVVDGLEQHQPSP